MRRIASLELLLTGAARPGLQSGRLPAESASPTCSAQNYRETT